MAIVLRAEIVAGAADVPAVADVIVDAAVAVDAAAVVGGIADAAGQAGEGTKTFSHGFARITTDKPETEIRATTKNRGLFCCAFELRNEMSRQAWLYSANPFRAGDSQFGSGAKRGTAVRPSGHKSGLFPLWAAPYRL